MEIQSKQEAAQRILYVRSHANLYFDKLYDDIFLSKIAIKSTKALVNIK